jgi:ankyrin repeat protein
MEFSTALWEGNEGTILRLLDTDPTLLERMVDRWDRPLAIAARDGHLGVVGLLIERGANVNATGACGLTALHIAAQYRHPEVVALLLDEGAHANVRDDDGMTPLMLASDSGHLDVVEMLVQHMGGKGLDERSDRGWTALHYAAAGGHVEVVRFLLLAGADSTTTHDEGMTPRAVAEEGNRYDEMVLEGRARCVDVFQVRPLTC